MTKSSLQRFFRFLSETERLEAVDAEAMLWALDVVWQSHLVIQFLVLFNLAALFI